MEEAACEASPPAAQAKGRSSEKRSREESTFAFVRAIEGHEGTVSTVRFQPTSGKLLASASADRTVRIWDCETGNQTQILRGHEAGLNDVSWRKNGGGVCSASDDSTVNVWNVETGDVERRLQGHTNLVFSARCGTSENLVVSGSFDETVRVWDMRVEEAVRVLNAHSDPVTSVDIDHEDGLMVTASFDGMLRIWDVSNGKCLKTIVEAGDCCPLTYAEFTPNGKFMLVMRLDGVMLLVDADSNQIKRRYRGHINEKYCLIPAITRVPGPTNNRWLVSGSEDGSIALWDVQRKKKNKKLEDQDGCVQVSQRIGHRGEFPDGHCAPVTCVDTNSTENLVVTGSAKGDASIRLWQERLVE
ncbi:hypothetical protein BSKO_00521 [Bryopsis sp. KO-2023]|nr:hypothetical protein BSKO_00521 [Bryopsis sp. KO-2023]